MTASVVEEWSRRNSFVHRCDSRFKFVALVFTLVVLGTTRRHDFSTPAALGVLAILVAPMLRLPAQGIAWRAAVMTLFTLPFSSVLAMNGNTSGAAALLLRTWCSGLWVLLFVGTTTAPAWLQALRWFRLPGLLVEVIYFIYRYLTQIASQGHRMRTAALARGGASFVSVRGIVAVLFARSIEQAERSHSALSSRGYTGQMPWPSAAPAQLADGIMLLLTCSTVALIRWTLAMLAK